jgi:uncharacterized protein
LTLLYRFMIFLLCTAAILAGIHSYFWLRLVRETQVPLPYRTWATAACVVLAGSVPLSLIAPRLMPRSWATLASWPGYIWLGLMLLLFASLVTTDALRLVFIIGRTVSGSPKLDPATRLMLARLVAAGIGATVAVAGVYSVIQGLRVPVVKELRIALPGLPPALVGTSIVQLTDLHIGATKRSNFCQDSVQRANALAPM